MSAAGTVGVILAGGRARRMGGGDKPLRTVGGQSILSRTIACLEPQVDRLAISANGDARRFAAAGLPVLPDPVADTGVEPAGPLAGILAGLDWAAALGAAWLVSVPGDCPFLPDDLVLRLHAAVAGATYAMAASGGRPHPVAALWPVGCRDALRAALGQGERKIVGFTGRHGVGLAEWAAAPRDPFLNVNTPEDLRAADAIVRAV